MPTNTELNTLSKTENSSGSERWQKAQCSELVFWQERAQAPIAEDYPVGLAQKAHDLILKMNLSNLDPLIHDYRDIYPNFKGITKTDIVSIDELPAAEKFDYIVLENVIDHISDPKPIIRQLRDKLTDSGSLLITCHTIPSMLQPAEPILNVIDPPHPHHFTHQYLEEMIKELGYSITTSFTINLRETHPDFSLSTVAKQRSFRSLKRYSATWILNTSVIVANKVNS